MLMSNNLVTEGVRALAFSSHGIDPAILEHSGFSTGVNYLFIAYFVAGYNLNQCWLAVLKLNLAVKFQLKYTDFHWREIH